MAGCEDDRLIHVATVGRPHGVRGFVHLFPLTESPDTVMQLSPLKDAAGNLWHVRWTGPGIAALENATSGVISTREAAAAVVNLKLFASRAQLPAAQEGEFYHADLMGLTAADRDGEILGKVTNVHDYGAGVSLEITGEGQSWIVPFTEGCVPHVDVAAGQLEVVLPDEVEVEGDLSGDADVVVRQ